MPKLTGAEVRAQLEADPATADSRVVILTAFGEADVQGYVSGRRGGVVAHEALEHGGSPRADRGVAGEIAGPPRGWMTVVHPVRAGHRAGGYFFVIGY